MKPLPRSFYERSSIEVAKNLLGKILVRKVADGVMAGKIVEVEAYGGPEDPASHARFGLRPWNRVMFGEVGRAYIYRIYGLHYCLNVVAKSRNEIAGAVLIRAIEPIKGIDLMFKFRFKNSKGKITELTSGPAKLCKAMKIDLTLNGTDLTIEGPLYIAENSDEEFEITVTPRIGVKEGLDKLWRFYIKNNRFVSRK